MSDFIEKCLEGKALPDDIDDFIDLWHEGTGEVPLHRYLGMSWSEYSLWVADPDRLLHIINAHRSGKPGTDIPPGTPDRVPEQVGFK